MRVPVSWLRQHVSAASYNLDTIAERLTIGGSEIETIEHIGAQHPAVVAGVIIDGEPIKPGLRKMSVDVGLPEPVTLVTKSENLQAAPAGTCIAVARPGATILSLGDDGMISTLQIKDREIAGVPSQGVGCSAQDIGVGKDNSEVMIIEPAVKAGTALKDLFPITEHNAFGTEDVLEIAILPNIARCQSVLGVARETGALLDVDADLAVPLADVALTSSDIDPSSEDDALCTRFGVALVDGIKVGPSPLHIQQRLIACGVTPTNNVVDATNYVMMELGQPTHAYDANKLSSFNLTARRAKAGETLLPLGAAEDDEPLALQAGLPVIDCDGKPVALAGVIGGHETRVTNETTRILLESANFDYIDIRRSQAATLTFTEASARFSRGVDPALVPVAIQRIVEVLKETCPDISVAKTGHFGAQTLPERSIPLNVADLNRYLGTDLDVETVERQLRRVGLSASGQNGDLTVSIPSSRADITIPCDLMEEVARLHGFDRLPNTMPEEPVPLRLQDHTLKYRFDIANQLVINGLQETISYSLSSQEREQKLFAGRDLQAEPYVTLQNPLTTDRSAMRRHLLPNLLDCAQANLRHQAACHLFELGLVFHPEKDGVHASLPKETYHLGVVMTGPITDSSLYDAKPVAVDFFDLKQAISAVCSHLHITDLSFHSDDVAPYHPGVCARLESGGTTLGWLGELHPLAAEAYGLGDQKVYAAELNIETLLNAVPETFKVPEPPRFPHIEVDLSLLMKKEIHAQQAIDVIQEVASDLLRNVVVFDVYEGSNVAQGHKAIGLRLQLGAAARTLAMPEAEAVRDKIVQTLSERFGISLR